MDTMLAILKNRAAIASGKPGKVYDYAKAKARILEVKPKEAMLGMAEDWGWTAETVWEDGKFCYDLDSGPAIAGIGGSTWATPSLEMDGEIEDCWKVEARD